MSEKQKEQELQATNACADIETPALKDGLRVSEDDKGDLKTITYAAVFAFNGNFNAAISALLLGKGRISRTILKTMIRAEDELFRLSTVGLRIKDKLAKRN